MARDIGGRAVDWFEQGRIRSFRVEVGRGCDPDGPGDGGCHFREQVTEEVGTDDVEGVRASTSLAARASACIKDASTSGKSEDISRKISSKNGIVTLIPFDLVAPIRRPRLPFASPKAWRIILSTPRRIKMLSWTAISYGVPLYTRPPESEYSPSVFSLTTVISRPFGAASGLFTPRKSRAGRKFTYWSNVRLMGSKSPQRER